MNQCIFGLPVNDVNSANLLPWSSVFFFLLLDLAAALSFTASKLRPSLMCLPLSSATPGNVSGQWACENLHSSVRVTPSPAWKFSQETINRNAWSSASKCFSLRNASEFLPVLNKIRVHENARVNMRAETSDSCEYLGILLNHAQHLCHML